MTLFTSNGVQTGLAKSFLVCSAISSIILVSAWKTCSHLNRKEPSLLRRRESEDLHMEWNCLATPLSISKRRQPTPSQRSGSSDTL